MCVGGVVVCVCGCVVCVVCVWGHYYTASTVVCLQHSGCGQLLKWHSVKAGMRNGMEHGMEHGTEYGTEYGMTKLVLKESC